MLEIDYELFLLSKDENEQIARRALALAKRGKVPPLNPASFGRVIVVNPNEGFTIHHIPDDLRKPLRRATHSVYSGSRPLPASKLTAEILEKSHEIIYEIVIELHSDFPELIPFLKKIPQIRKAHPQCRVSLHGDMERIFELLKDFLTETGATCELFFENMDETIILQNQHDLNSVKIDLPRYPTLPRPFFSHLVIQLGNTEEIFDLNGLKKLYKQYGVGHIEELDISGKLREKLIVLDIPMSLVKFFRFKENRGDRFRAIKIDGKIILSSQLDQAGLLGRKIPFQQIESIYRMMPGKEVEEEIKFDRIRSLRVNCFDGHISFLWKPNQNYIPLYEVKRMQLNWGGKEKAAPASFDDLDADTPRSLKIETTIITEKGQPKFGDVRAGIRHKFLQQLYFGSLERNVKLQRFASKIRIATMGPMTAQIINLLKPLGLSKILPPGTMYYLCDNYDQISDFRNYPERIREVYNQAVDSFKSIFNGPPPIGLDIQVIIHRLPLINEWARGEIPSFENQTTEHLDTLYKEFKIFISFCETEFRRVELEITDVQDHFSHLEKSRDLSLQFRHLASLLGGRYGKLPDAGFSPDFVFFGSEGHTIRNRKQFHLPAIALSKVFKDKDNQKVFYDEDFNFTVFLEEQLAIIAHLKSQEYEPPPDEIFYREYFEKKIKNTEKELLELSKYPELDQENTSVDLNEAMEQLKEEHQDETKSFRVDNDVEAQKLEILETRYFELLKSLNKHQEKMGFAPVDPMAGDDYMKELDDQLLRNSKEGLQNLREKLKKNTQATNESIKEKRTVLTSFLNTFIKIQKSTFAKLQAEFATNLTKRYQKVLPALIDRLNEYRRASDSNIVMMENNLNKRHEPVLDEFSLLEAEMGGITGKIKKEMATLHANTRKISEELSLGSGGKTGDSSPQEILSGIQDRLKKTSEKLASLIESAENCQQSLEGMNQQYSRKAELAAAIYQGENELALFAQRKVQSKMRQKVGKKLTEPLIAVPSVTLASDPAFHALQIEQGKAEWDKQKEILKEFTSSHQILAATHREIEDYLAFQKVLGQFQKTVVEKMTLQKSIVSISSRLQQLEGEAKNLADFIKKRILPGHRILSEKVLIPNSRKKISYFNRAFSFIEEMKQISFEDLQREYLDRAIFRRFYASQFRKGAYFGINPDHPLFPKLNNITPAIFLVEQAWRKNLTFHGFQEHELGLTKLASDRPAGITRFIEDQIMLPHEERLNFLILPGTLSLVQALEIMETKENIFKGLPQLVLIFISKFNTKQIIEDEHLRETYFKALKHSVIINVDDVQVVDNPKAIADRLLAETLGRAHDLKEFSQIIPQDKKSDPA